MHLFFVLRFFSDKLDSDNQKKKMAIPENLAKKESWLIDEEECWAEWSEEEIFVIRCGRKRLERIKSFLNFQITQGKTIWDM